MLKSNERQETFSLSGKLKHKAIPEATFSSQSTTLTTFKSDRHENNYQQPKGTANKYVTRFSIFRCTDDHLNVRNQSVCFITGNDIQDI